MPKIPITIEPTVLPERRRSKLTRLACIIAVGLVLAVPITEAASLFIGQWYEVMGTNTEVRTPVLDSVNDGLQSTQQSFSSWMSDQFRRVPWDPAIVLPIAAVVMVVGILMLKK